MANPVRSRSFANFVGAPGVFPGVTLYTCPANLTDIVKFISLDVAAAAGHEAAVSVVSGAQIGVVMVVQGGAVTDNWAAEECFVVLEPGDKLVLSADGPGTNVSCHVSGAELQGVHP